jgi:hypothetical protein
MPFRICKPSSIPTPLLVEILLRLALSKLLLYIKGIPSYDVIAINLAQVSSA